MIARAFLLGVLALVSACGTSRAPVAVDSPEAAVQRLEAAYRAKDIEAVVYAKDFASEARLMLQKIAGAKPGREDLSGNPEILRKTAETLELSFRKHIEKDGFPDFSEVRCSFEPNEPVHPDLVIVHETCVFADGGSSRQRLYVAKTSKGWRVLNPID